MGPNVDSPLANVLPTRGYVARCSDCEDWETLITGPNAELNAWYEAAQHMRETIHIF